MSVKREKGKVKVPLSQNEGLAAVVAFALITCSTLYVGEKIRTSNNRVRDSVCQTYEVSMERELMQTAMNERQLAEFRLTYQRYKEYCARR